MDPTPDPIAGGLATIRRRLAICSLSLTLTGCIPFPHCVRTASELSGQVTENGQPLAGVTVKRVLSDSTNVEDESCDRPGDEAVTDAAGRFSFTERTRFLAGIQIMGDPSFLPFRVTLCARQDGQWYQMLIAWRPLVEPGFHVAAIPHVQIDCELHPGPDRSEICKPTAAPVS